MAFSHTASFNSTATSAATILDERGLRTGAGETFDSTSVQWVRTATGLESLKERLLAAGMLTGKQIRARLGVGRTTLAARRRQGRVQGRICNELGEWLYRPPDTIPHHAPAPDTHVAASDSGGCRAGGAV